MLEIDDDGRIATFKEKARGGRAPFLVNSGVYVLERGLVEDLEPGTSLDFAHDVFPRVLEQDGTLRVHRLQEPVIDVGTPEGLAAARVSAATHAAP